MGTVHTQSQRGHELLAEKVEILGGVNMGTADLQRRILELEEQVNNLARDKRKLEERVEELTPDKMFVATLSSDKLPYWVEV